MKRIIRNVGLLLGGVLVAMTLFGCDNLKSPPEERLADELCQKIIDALQKDDADALKKNFGSRSIRNRRFTSGYRILYAVI
ncbi:MAG: hypothetical protein ACLVEX_12640 [Ruthenibacterium lactatiformans]